MSPATYPHLSYVTLQIVRVTVLELLNTESKLNQQRTLVRLSMGPRRWR